jgi:hypothetical protein
MNCRDCGMEIETMSDDEADDLSMDGFDDDEIDACRTRCDECRIDGVIAENFDLFLEVMRKNFAGSPSGKLN